MIRTMLCLFCLILLWPALAFSGDYKVQSGDVLRIEVLEDASLNRDVLIVPDGTFTFPMVGSIRAKRRTIAQINRDLTADLAANFASGPTVYVSVARIAKRTSTPGLAKVVAAPTIEVFGMGELAKPGKMTVPPGTTFLQFLAQAGGFTRFAAIKRVQLRRTDPKTGKEAVYTINYRKMMARAGQQPPVLAAGDVIIVPERRLFE